MDISIIYYRHTNTVLSYYILFTIIRRFYLFCNIEDCLYLPLHKLLSSVIIWICHFIFLFPASLEELSWSKLCALIVLDLYLISILNIISKMRINPSNPIAISLVVLMFLSFFVLVLLLSTTCHNFFLLALISVRS